MPLVLRAGALNMTPAHYHADMIASIAVGISEQTLNGSPGLLKAMSSIISNMVDLAATSDIGEALVGTKISSALVSPSFTIQPNAGSLAPTAKLLFRLLSVLSERLRIAGPTVTNVPRDEATSASKILKRGQERLLSRKIYRERGISDATYYTGNPVMATTKAQM